MFKINLVPEVQEKRLAIKKANLYSTVSAIIVLIIFVTAILIIGGVNLAKSSELSKTKENVASTQKEVDSYKELENTVISLEKGLEGIKEISDGTNRWTKLLPHLENATPSDAKYTRLKLASSALEGTVECASVDSLAKMVESYKKYQVIALGGQDEVGKSLSISIDGNPMGTVVVKSTGSWNMGIHFDPNADHAIKVDNGSGKTVSIKYTAKDKKIESTDSTVTAESKYLFTDVETNQYQKKEGSVTFDIKYNFDLKIIW